jgi:hypothetical protein
MTPELGINWNLAMLKMNFVRTLHAARITEHRDAYAGCRIYSEWIWYELTAGESFNGMSVHMLTKNKNRLFNQADR